MGVALGVYSSTSEETNNGKRDLKKESSHTFLRPRGGLPYETDGDA